jgi:hypothetical protein
MTDVTVQTVADLSEGKSPQALAGATLAATKYSARATGWPTDYRGLVNACCDAARPLSDALFAKGCRAWLILIGAAFDAERKSRFPNYALARPARERNLVEDIAMEKIFHLTKAERTAGIYLMNADRFCDGCEFLTRNLWAQIILSRQDDFLSETNLELIYQSGGFDDNGMPDSQINWLALSAAVCPLGNVVVKTHGAFDDRWREVKLVYAAGNPLIRM